MSEQHDTLGPCLLCQSKKTGFRDHGLPETQVGCNDCGLTTRYYANRELALAAWNLRSPAATSLPDGVEAALALFNDALDIMFDGPDESDRAMAHKKWGEALQIVTTLTPAPAQPTPTTDAETQANLDGMEKAAKVADAEREKWSCAGGFHNYATAAKIIADHIRARALAQQEQS